MAASVPTKREMQDFVLDVGALDMERVKAGLGRFGADIVEAGDNCRYTPLMTTVIAAARPAEEHRLDQWREMAKLLLDHGASVDKIMPLGTAMVFYISHDAKFLELLLDHGADVEWKSSIGNTTLIMAAGQQQHDSVRLLLARGAKVDAKNSLGRTALFIAMAKNDVEMVRLLLAGGADWTICDKEGKTAEERAKEVTRDTSDACMALQNWISEQVRREQQVQTAVARHQHLLKSPRIVFSPKRKA